MLKFIIDFYLKIKTSIVNFLTKHLNKIKGVIIATTAVVSGYVTYLAYSLSQVSTITLILMALKSNLSGLLAALSAVTLSGALAYITGLWATTTTALSTATALSTVTAQAIASISAISMFISTLCVSVIGASIWTLVINIADYFTAFYLATNFILGVSAGVFLLAIYYGYLFLNREEGRVANNILSS